MTVPRDPLDVFADMVRGAAKWVEDLTEKVENVTAGLADEHRGEHVPPRAPHDCSDLALDMALSPGTPNRTTRAQCRTCGTWWAPVFDGGILIGWTPTVIRTSADARFIPEPHEALITAERERRAATRKLDHVCIKPYLSRGAEAAFTCPECGLLWTAATYGGETIWINVGPPADGRTPGVARWRTGRPHVEAERESLLFEQGPAGDRFIGEMISPEFAQWIVTARAVALDHDFEGGYHAASASADAFRDHYVALLGLDERPDDITLRRLLTEEMARLSSIARAAAEARNEGA